MTPLPPARHREFPRGGSGKLVEADRKHGAA
jgi:hypothetical protein